MSNLFIITGASSCIGIELLNNLSKRKKDNFILQVNKNKKKIKENKKITNLNKKIISCDFSIQKNINLFTANINKNFFYNNIYFIHLPSSIITLKKTQNYSPNQINSQIMIQAISLLLIYKNLLNNNNFNKLKIVIINSEIIDNKIIPGTLDYSIGKYSLEALYKNILFDIRNSNKIFVNSIYPTMFNSTLTTNIPNYLKDKINNKEIIKNIINKIKYLIKNDVSCKDIYIK